MAQRERRARPALATFKQHQVCAMVFYFFPRGHVEGKDDYLIYMGRDKYENEVWVRLGTFQSSAWPCACC